MSTFATDQSASPPASEHAGPEPSSYNSKSAVPRRQRIPRACDSCRRKKIRCNLSQTVPENATAEASAGVGTQKCQHCKQSGTPCLFTKTPAKRGPSKGYIQQLESRLAALESSTKLDHSRTPGNTLPPVAPHSTTRKAPYDSVPSSSTVPAKKPRVVGGLPALKNPPIRQVDSNETLLSQSHMGNAPSSSSKSPVPPAPSVLASGSTASPTVSQPQSAPIASSSTSFTTPHLPNITTGLPSNPQKSTLPPISRLLSQVPSSGQVKWEGLPSHRSMQLQNHEGNKRDPSSHYYHPYFSPHLQHRDLHSASAPLPRSRSPYASGWLSHQPAVLPSPQVGERQSARTSAHPDRPPSRTHMDLLHSSMSGTFPSTSAINTSDRYPEKVSPSSSSPVAPFQTSITRSSTPASHLGRLDKSAILSLDTPALRKALFATPAFKTFALLSPSLLETGLKDSQNLIRVAYQLVNSTSTMQTSNDAHWQLDVAEIIGQCMMPTPSTKAGPERMCRDIETLLLCYVDTVRRGRYISGILGCISGKLGDVQARGVDCRRYKASLTLLSVWNCVAFSSHALYYTVPRADRPDDLFEALEGSDPDLRAVCIFTGALDSMCRRYTEDSSHIVPPETLELSLPAVIEHHVDLPAKQTRLLATLDSYLLLLNFMYNIRPSIQASLEVLERQRRHLYGTLRECNTCGATGLSLGVHVLSLVAVVTAYCLSVCCDLSDTMELEDQRLQLYHALQRDYLNILDSLKNTLTALSTPLDSVVFNSHPFADSGDSRILYSIVASYVKLHISAAALGSHKLLEADDILLSFNSLGYMGHILGVVEAQESNRA